MPNESPRVSVIVPTYNRALQLVGALDSVLAQTYGNLEAIVVDDGSTDGTEDVVRKRYEADPRVAYVRQENGGVARARNTGLERAQGEVIAFLDSDDAWRPWKLELQLACLQRAPQAGMIWTNMEAVDAGGNVVPGSSLRDILSFRFSLEELFAERIPLAELPGTPPELQGATLYVGDIFAKMVLGNLVLPSAAVLTRARLDRVERFDESLRVAGEDFDFFLRACREGTVAFVDVPSVLYATGREDQLTHPSKKLHLARNYLRVMDGAIARDPERVDLPPAMVRDARAHAHSWTGRAYLEAGDSRAARRHLREALRLSPTDKRTLALAPLALLPGAVCAQIFRLLRWLMRLARGRPASPAVTAR